MDMFPGQVIARIDVSKDSSAVPELTPYYIIAQVVAIRFLSWETARSKYNNFNIYKEFCVF